MQRKALSINERLGCFEGIAIQHANLGRILNDRGNPTEARELWTKARGLYVKIGLPHMVAKMQAWIDALPDAEDGTTEESEG